jgi:hypothetical protein
MTVTPERRAELYAMFDEIVGNRRPKPKVVARDDIGTVRDADVHVSRADPNAARGVAEVVTVRRPEWVTVNMAAYERQWEMAQADRAAARAHRKAIDPYNLGHWGPIDEDE